MLFRSLVRFDRVVDSVKVVGHEVIVVVPWPVARAATDYSGGKNAVSEAAVVFVLHDHDTMIEGKELREFAEGSSLCTGVASDVHQGLLNVNQYKRARGGK